MDSSLIGKEPGDITLAEAKSVAAKNYSERYQEVEGFLDEFLDDGQQDDDLHIWRDEGGAIMCRVDEPDLHEVQIEVTLRHYEDSYYDGYGCVTLSSCTIRSYSSRRNLVDDVRQAIRRGR